MLEGSPISFVTTILYLKRCISSRRKLISNFSLILSPQWDKLNDHKAITAVNLSESHDNSYKGNIGSVSSIHPFILCYQFTITMLLAGYSHKPKTAQFPISHPLHRRACAVRIHPENFPIPSVCLYPSMHLPVLSSQLRQHARTIYPSRSIHTLVVQPPQQRSSP